MVGGNPRERTSLIATVLDEAGTIDALLSSVLVQTHPPDEIVIVDGGSTDATWPKLLAWRRCLPLRTLRSPGASIATGRNLAIKVASGELIAVTDAGVRLANDWLEQLHAALTPEVDVVGGFFTPDPSSTFERALGATTLPRVEDIRPEAFLPSSRSVLFRRTAWDRVNGYPDWLDYCEDLVFDLALKHAGCRFAFAPRALVWFRPRRSAKAFFRQYYLYARGDGKAGLWWSRHAVRYATYVAAAAAVLRRRGPDLLVLLLGALLYTRRPYQRLDLDDLSRGQRLGAIALVPVLRLVGDTAKMLGYPVGVWWRLRRAWTSRSSS